MDKIPRIYRELQDRIISGSFALGQRIPTQTELMREYNISSATVQIILGRLADDGYVIPNGRKGTFVSEKPPYLKRIALLCPLEDSKGMRAFFRLFIDKGQEIANELGYDIEVIYGYMDWKLLGNYQKLVEQVESQLLAGIIFSSNPFILNNTSLVELPDIPQIAFMQGKVYDGIDSVWIDYEQMMEKSLNYCYSIGRKRVSVIFSQLNIESIIDLSVFEKYGLEYIPFLSQSISLEEPSWAGNFVHLMMRLRPAERPDFLIVADDSMVYHATKVLKELGIRVPEDIVVVGHANLPWSTESALPIRRIGFRLDECLRHCMNSLVARRKGEEVESYKVMPAIFEDEMS